MWVLASGWSNLSVSLLLLTPFLRGQITFGTGIHLPPECTHLLQLVVEMVNLGWFPNLLLAQYEPERSWVDCHIPDQLWVTSSLGKGAAFTAPGAHLAQCKQWSLAPFYTFPRKPLLYVVNLQESGSSDSSSLFLHIAFTINALSVWVDYFIWSRSRSQGLPYSGQIYSQINLLWASYLLCS